MSDRAIPDKMPSEFHDPRLRVQQQAGFIPIEVQPATTGHEVVWFDVGDHQFTKAKFEFAIQRMRAEPNARPTVTMNIEHLTTPSFLPDTLYPSGFVFHMSRCGSTLFARALARTRDHIVIDEGTPLNDGLWDLLTGGWRQPVSADARSLQICRNLILALGRRRIPEQQRYFVKFRSWNVLFIELITQAFPDVPCLFLYRDPVEVLVSSQWNPVWTLDFKATATGAYMIEHSLAATQAMDDLTFLAKVFARYFVAALQTNVKQLSYLNYEQLTRANFPAILMHAFNYQPTADQLALMQTQFDYYSKDDEDAVRFTPDKEAKQAAATTEIRRVANEEIMATYAQIERSARNLVQWLP